jgi:hypothetical protein
MNEFQQLQNPDNVPGRVSSGYQRQNTNMYAIQTGLDTTEPYDNGSGLITIPAGGLVELNGVMFKLTAGIELQKPVAAQAYWVAITDNGDGVGDTPSTASASLVDRPGAWNPAKKGCYRTDGSRTLNWVSLGSLASTAGLPIVHNSGNVKGSAAIQLSPGWYRVEIVSGSGGGNGGNGGNGVAASTGGSSNGGAGGAGGSATNKITKYKIFFFDKSGQHDIKVGGNGGNGGTGGQGGGGENTSSYNYYSGGGGGGGGGGTGESTSFDDFETGEVPCGAGGHGGDGSCDGGGGAGVPGGNFVPTVNFTYDRKTSGRTGGADNGGDGGGIGGESVSGSTSSYGGRGGRGGSSGGSAGAMGINGGPGAGGGAGGGGGGRGIDGKNRPDGFVGAGSCEVRRIE